MYMNVKLTDHRCFDGQSLWRRLRIWRTREPTTELRRRSMGGSWENWRRKKNLRFIRRQRANEKAIEKLIAAFAEMWVDRRTELPGLRD